MSVNVPLEIQNPKKYGELDGQQLYLMCENSALDLLLLENASDLFKNLMFNTEGLLEYILTEISKGTDTTVLESIAFDFQDMEMLAQFNNSSNKIPPPEIVPLIDQLNNMADMIERLKTRFVIGIFSLVHKDNSAHYGALIYDSKKKNKRVFDSMMFQEDLPYMASSYSPYFYTISDYIFNTRNAVFPSCLKLHQALQYTGGFSSNYAHYLKVAKDKEMVSDRDIYDFNLQSTDSQNHFCYMWAIWYIHLTFLNNTLDDIKHIIQKKDPLIIIKTYAYSLLYNVYLKGKSLIDYIEQRDFFDANFPCIWSQNMNAKKPFKRYDIVEEGNYNIKSGKLDMKQVWLSSLDSKQVPAKSALQLLSVNERNILNKECERKRTKTLQMKAYQDRYSEMNTIRWNNI